MLLIDSKYSKIAKLLDLDKPLVIFDVETTGLAISADKVIALAYIKIWKGGKVQKEDLLFDPEIKINPEATAIHGIRHKHVKSQPKFRERARELWEAFSNCYYSGFNVVDFDLPILRREFIRVGMDFDYRAEDIIDAKKIYEYLSPRTLTSAYRHYCNKELKLEHSARYHTEVTSEILLKQLEKYKEVRNSEFRAKMHGPSFESDDKTASKKFYWVGGEAYFAFSKYQHKSLSWVIKKDPAFLEWMLEADFGGDVKNIIKTSYQVKTKN